MVVMRSNERIDLRIRHVRSRPRSSTDLPGLFFEVFVPVGILFDQAFDPLSMEVGVNVFQV